MFSCGLARIGISRCQCLWKEENRRTRRKTLGARREPTTHLWQRAGIEPGLVHIGRRRALSPRRHPCSQVAFCYDMCLSSLVTYLNSSSRIEYMVSMDLTICIGEVRTSSRHCLVMNSKHGGINQSNIIYRLTKTE